MEKLQTLTGEELTGSLGRYAKTVFTYEVWPQYLSVSANFHTFSLANTLLLCAQKPDALYVGGYHWWRDEFGRHVRKGEKAIRLVFPEYGEDCWRTASVFDVSQTAGARMPSFLTRRFMTSLKDDPLFLQSLLLASPVPVRFEETTAGVAGYYRPLDQEIIIRQGMPAEETIRVLLYEIASALVHQEHSGDSRQDRIRREIETAGIAGIVSRRFMLSADPSRFRHIGLWAKDQSPADLTGTLETIRCAADKLIRLICAVRDPQAESSYPEPLSLIAA